MKSIRDQVAFINALELIHKADRCKDSKRINAILDEYLSWCINEGHDRLEVLMHIRNHFALHEPPTTACEVDEHIEVDITNGDRKYVATRISSFGRNSVYYWLIEQEKSGNQEQQKSSTSKTKPKKSFSNIIQYKDPVRLLDRLHELIDGCSGADVGCVLLRAIQTNLLKRRPTQKEFESEFRLIGSWNAIHKYMNDNNENALDRANKIIIFD